MAQILWSLGFVFSLVLLSVISFVPFLGSGQTSGTQIDLDSAFVATLAIVGGVLARSVYVHMFIEENKGRISIRGFAKQTVRAMFIAPIVLAVVFQELITLSGLAFVLVSFQNGFFFQTLLEGKS